MIKSVLNNYPLYHCSMMLDPNGMLTKIEGLLKNFLQQGGKNRGGKKFALISWKKIKMPWMEGGLQLRDLKFQNMAVGEKILWNLFEKKTSWSSQVIWHKDFVGSRMRCLENEPIMIQVSPIFMLCKKALTKFKDELFLILGNRRYVRIWNDSILGKSPLNSYPALYNFKN